jgi:beta-phosphoglucomutase-like phosphatase (HAD superfamily)
MTAATPRSRPVRLVIADVDGTLVTQEKVLTQRAIEASSDTLNLSLVSTAE